MKKMHGVHTIRKNISVRCGHLGQPSVDIMRLDLEPITEKFVVLCWQLSL